MIAKLLYSLRKINILKTEKLIEKFVLTEK